MTIIAVCFISKQVNFIDSFRSFETRLSSYSIELCWAHCTSAMVTSPNDTTQPISHYLDECWPNSLIYASLCLGAFVMFVKIPQSLNHTRERPATLCISNEDLHATFIVLTENRSLTGALLASCRCGPGELSLIEDNQRNNPLGKRYHYADNNHRY